jgi:hypothetical protein
MKPPHKAKTKARTHFVPRTVYRRAFAGVVPLCVAACSSSTTSSGDGGTMNGAVGCSAFGCLGVANFGFDSGFDGVASQAFDGGDAADAAHPDAGSDAPVFTVACLGFCVGGADGASDAHEGGGDGGERG